MAGPDPANPWSFDAFDPYNGPKVDAPEPFKAAPRTFPEEERLFKIQKNALRAARAAEGLQNSLGEMEGREKALLRELVDATEDTYRVINSYLKKYVAPGVGAGL